MVPAECYRAILAGSRRTQLRPTGCRPTGTGVEDTGGSLMADLRVPLEMTYGPSILAALGAAVSFAFAAVLQQESTQSVSEDKSLSLGLITELLHRQKWLAGGACLLAGFGLQALALAYGPVAVVQPIVVTELAFAIPDRHPSAPPPGRFARVGQAFSA